MTAALLTGPASEPVSLDEAKAHLRVDGDEDDAAPLVTVDAVTVYDAEGDPETVDPASYTVDTVSEPGRLALKNGVNGTAGRPLNGIEIDVTAGYGPSGVDVPSPLRQALMMLVAHWFEHRGAVGHDLAGALMPYGYEALIAPYRVLQL